MTWMNFTQRFMRDPRGASAAEFALILPLIALFFFGIIDAGRYAYEFNRGEKATQIGARAAVVTSPVVQELATYTYSGRTVGGVLLGQGDRIPAAALGTISCEVSGANGSSALACTCEDGSCLGGSLTPDSAAFDIVANRIQEIWPEVSDADVEILYTGSGLGFAGNPNGPDISPFVTVKLNNMTFNSVLLFGASIGLPDFEYTLTMEDGEGSAFN